MIAVGVNSGGSSPGGDGSEGLGSQWHEHVGEFEAYRWVGGGIANAFGIEVEVEEHFVDTGRRVTGEVFADLVERAGEWAPLSVDGRVLRHGNASDDTPEQIWVLTR